MSKATCAFYPKRLRDQKSIFNGYRTLFILGHVSGILPFKIDKKTDTVYCQVSSFIPLISITSLITIGLGISVYCSKRLDFNVDLLNIQSVSTYIQMALSIVLYFSIMFDCIWQRKSHCKYLNSVNDTDIEFYQRIDYVVDNPELYRKFRWRYRLIIIFLTGCVIFSEYNYVVAAKMGLADVAVQFFLLLMILSIFVSAFYTINCARFLNIRFEIVQHELIHRATCPDKLIALLDLVQKIWHSKVLFNQTFGTWLLYTSAFDLILLIVNAYRFILMSMIKRIWTTVVHFILFVIYLLPYVMKNVLLIKEINQIGGQVRNGKIILSKKLVMFNGHSIYCTIPACIIRRDPQ